MRLASPTTVQVAELARRHGGRLSRFALVGIVNTLIDVGVWAALFWLLDWPLLLANSAGYIAGLLNSYVLNRIWTFRASGGFASFGQFGRFAIVSLSGLALANFAIDLLARVLHPLPAKLGAVAVTLVWNYLATARFVFPDRSRGGPRAGHPE